MTYRTVPSLLAGLAITLTIGLATGCGGGDDAVSVPDARTPVDGDGPRDGGNPCSYQEADDDGNATAAEATGLALADDAVLICGAVTPRAPASGLIDRDRYVVASGGGDVVVRLRAPDGRDVAELEVNLNDGDTYLGRGLFVGSHAVFLGQLEPGEVILEIVARDLEAPPAAIAYQIEIVPDDRAARCPTVTANPSFTEVGDTMLNFNAGNDMVVVTFGPDTVAQTSATSDAPEATNLVVTDGMSYELAGSLGVNDLAITYDDDYLDRDTFLIATGGQTTELAIRVTWPEDGVADSADDADLDVVLFRVPADADAAPIELAAGAHGGELPPELEATAVLPSTTYWLWVGNYQDSAQPKPYELTICGVDFAP